MALIVVQVRSDPKLIAELDSIEMELQVMNMHLANLSSIADSLEKIAAAFSTERVPTSIEFTAGTPREE